MSHQAKIIREDYPTWKIANTFHRLTAEGKIRPTVFSPNYLIHIEYTSLDNIPQVTLLSPEIETRDGELPPHLLNNEKKTLCLCYPKLKEWKKTDLISSAIIPRISLWLYYYEHWLVFGKWLGGGTVHFKRKPIEIEECTSF